MAAVIGDYMTDQLRFHNTIAASALSHDHNPEPRRSESHSRPRAPPSQRSHSPDSLPRYRSATTGSKSSDRRKEPSGSEAEQQRELANSGASRFPTPPDSSSPDPSAQAKAHDANCPSTGSMSTQTQTTASAVSSTTTATAQPQQQPSPTTEPAESTSHSDPSHAATPARTRTVVVRDLAHIQSLAQDDMTNGGDGPGILNEEPLQAVKYEISGMPIGDVIEMVAALLSKITSTNDLQHDALHRNAAHQQTAASHNNDGSSMTLLSSSVLAFHGKNVPAITILSYLSRIHKYCPTTYEVFLSLLVYFDRMTERVNSLVVQAEESKRQSKSQSDESRPAAAAKSAQVANTQMKGDEQDVDETNSDLADDDDENEGAEKAASSASSATYFVVDSFNIHRLIIAGVTCASKFFSDVFYTNSRYAKVGGLPLAELNHLELQFLLLNDFRLAVPVEDLEAYGTMLVEFYAREVCAQRSRSAGTE